MDPAFSPVTGLRWEFWERVPGLWGASHQAAREEEPRGLLVCGSHFWQPWPQGYSLVHGEAHQAPAEALGPLLLQGLAPQEGDGGLEFAGEGQTRLQGAVIGPQVGVPVPVAWVGDDGVSASRGRHKPFARRTWAPAPAHMPTLETP